MGPNRTPHNLGVLAFALPAVLKTLKDTATRTEELENECSRLEKSTHTKPTLL